MYSIVCYDRPPHGQFQSIKICLDWVRFQSLGLVLVSPVYYLLFHASSKPPHDCSQHAATEDNNKEEVQDKIWEVNSCLMKEKNNVFIQQISGEIKNRISSDWSLLPAIWIRPFFPLLFLFSPDENWQSCNNPLRSVQAYFTADSAAVFTSEATTTSGCSIMSSPRPNVELSSSSFLCNPRSKVPKKREWILCSNKYTFWDGRNWTHFSLSSFCRLAHSLHWKTDLAMIVQAFLVAEHTRQIGPDISLAIWYLH